MVEKIVFDTNILLLPYQDRIDVFEILRNQVGSYQPFIPSFVVEELEGLARSSGETKAAAILGISFLAKFKDLIKLVQSQKHGTVDDSIINFAKIGGMSIFTNDLELKKKAENEGIKIYFYRKAKKGVGNR